MTTVEIKGKTGYGLMSLTWRPQPIPYEQAFATINNSIADGTTFLNAGEFYGNAPEDTYANLELLKAYFEKYPANRSKVTISVKGALPNMMADCSANGIATSINNIISFLPDKQIELFEPARMDPRVPVEECIRNIIPFIESGKIKGISLSEVKAETIERANKIYPISCVEVEFSMWSRDILSNGIMETCQRLGITVVAYSPLGRGYLTGTIKTVDDIPKGDFRSFFDRFKSDEILKANMALVDYITKFAESKNCSPAQLSLSWVRKFSEFPDKYARVVPIPSSSTPERNHENNTHIKLTDAEFDEINSELDRFVILGGRYNDHAAPTLNG